MDEDGQKHLSVTDERGRPLDPKARREMYRTMYRTSDATMPDENRPSGGAKELYASLPPDPSLLEALPDDPHWTDYLTLEESAWRWRNESTLRVCRRRMHRHNMRKFLAEWIKTKKRWDGGPDTIRKEHLEAVTKPVVCAFCKHWFPATRADQKTCSSRCRTALHRRRKTQV